MNAAEPANSSFTTALRNLYFVRFGFAIVWAILLAISGSELGAATVTLLLIYPLFDVTAAIVDARSSSATGATRALYVNIALSLLTAAGLAIAAASGVPDVLRVWGAWAITAGLVQLFVALGRRGLGGEWAMILSGSISAVAGTTFIIQAGSSDPSLTSLAGYATLGGIFFLISALRLRPASSSDNRTSAGIGTGLRRTSSSTKASTAK